MNHPTHPMHPIRRSAAVLPRLAVLSVFAALGAGAAPPAVAPPAVAPPAIAPPAVAPAPGDESPALPPRPETPLAIVELIAAQPFTVEIPWPTDWSADRAMVREGWIALLRVPHEVAVPRQTQEPVLYAGGVTVERIENFPTEDLVLAIIPATPRRAAVPGSAAQDAEGMRSLAESPIWYGAAELPEAVDAAAVSREIALAERAKLTVRPAPEVARALARGGAALQVTDRAALLEAAARLRPDAPDPAVP